MQNVKVVVRNADLLVKTNTVQNQTYASILDLILKLKLHVIREDSDQTDQILRWSHKSSRCFRAQAQIRSV